MKYQPGYLTYVLLRCGDVSDSTKLIAVVSTLLITVAAGIIAGLFRSVLAGVFSSIVWTRVQFEALSRLADEDILR